MAEYTMIKTEVRQQVGIVQLDRRGGANALSSAMLVELMDALRSFDRSQEVGAMVIAGKSRVFSPGADVKEMQDASVVELLLDDRIALFHGIREIKKPVVAAVSGYCLGGGNELAMACDLIVAAENARFGQPEINLGVIPGAGGTQRLTRAVGKAVAMEMILNNRHLSAEEALGYGLVNRVVPVERCLDEAVELASEIAERAPLAVRLAKEMVNRAYESFLQEGMEEERRAFYTLFASQDQKEGMAAFLEKRDPEWQGK
jgi:enoyl-CoA hydratase